MENTKGKMSGVEEMRNVVEMSYVVKMRRGEKQCDAVE